MKDIKGISPAIVQHRFT